ncbi:MAG: T9SS type A sorting domain-containing protein [Flavobacterium sp.]|uniref:T9SS type A sorting domain-containing protein n=1 Tax=Flavobacterium sp. TaxID=239 RepID=UPI003BC4DAA1
MKKITFLLLMLVSYSGFAQFPLPYCGPLTFTSNVEPITLVNFAGINNSTSAVVGANDGTTIIAHEDYSTLTGNVTAGSSYTITLKGNTDGNYVTYLRVYVDWNQNNDFTDAGESYDVGTITNSTGEDAIQLTGSILVPPTALTGNTRMRVIKRFNAYSTSCQTGTGFGQAEDYSLLVAPLPPDLPDYANLQFPYTATINQGGSVTVYGQIYEAGLTDVAPNITGQAPGILAWVGYSTTDTNPNTWTNWTAATWNSGMIGNNDEYQVNLGAGLLPGTYYYATRYQLNGGAFVYGGTNYGFWNGTDKINGVLTVNPPLPPANDNCSGATSLTVNSDFLCGTVSSGTVVGATASTQDAAACGGTEDDDVWFSFTATSTSHRISILNAAGSTTDMYHSLWTGADCNSLALVTGSCSDADVSNPTGLSIGQIYYVRVYTWNATAGQTTTFNVCVGTPPPPPTNDNFATPIAISCGNTYSGDTSTPVTLDEDNAPDGFGADMDAPNLWYSFTGSGSAQTVTLSLCNSSYDTSVLVYTGTSGNLTLVAGNDDFASCNVTNDSTRSKVIFTSDETTTYYVAVEGWNVGSVGAFVMDVTCAAVTPPAVANQDCGTALNVQVDGLDNNSDNSFGTVSSTQPSCDLFGSIQDVWFSFQAPASGNVTCLVTPTTMTSLNFNLYSGTCAALTALTGTCNSNLTVATSEVLTGLTPGETYFVQVWSNSAEQGTFTLKLSDNSLGNSSFDDANFSYFPNPVKNTLNLSYNQEISNVEVFNLLGQKVISNVINANAAQIDMSNLSKGAYMVKVTSNNQLKTIKVIKE